MERSGEFTPHLPPTLRYGATNNPFPFEGRGKAFADECRRALNLLSLNKGRGEGLINI